MYIRIWFCLLILQNAEPIEYSAGYSGVKNAGYLPLKYSSFPQLRGCVVMSVCARTLVLSPVLTNLTYIV